MTHRMPPFGAGIALSLPLQPVVVAFHSDNLPAVAQAYHEKYQDKILVIAGDNDHSKPIEKNVGHQKAQEAAALVGAAMS